jgi:hypothetical protein
VSEGGLELPPRTPGRQVLDLRFLLLATEQAVTVPPFVLHPTFQEHAHAMSEPLYSDTTLAVTHLVHDVERGTIALPELQRPYVWPASKARDLFDSMYKGLSRWFTAVMEDRRGTGRASDRHRRQAGRA